MVRSGRASIGKSFGEALSTRPGAWLLAFYTHNRLAVIVGLCARTNALMNLSCTLGAMASASRILPTDNWDQIQEVKSAYACPDEPRRNRSMLNGYSVQLASTKAPPLAENTEKSRGALIPRAPAIAPANNRSNTPLNRAAVRVCHPNSSRTPRIVSAQVETIARVVIVPFGKNQLSCPV